MHCGNSISIIPEDALRPFFPAYSQLKHHNSPQAYYDARIMLQDAGFSNIEIIAREDLWNGFLHNDQGNIGKIARVTIDGGERFNENDSYNKTAKIRIWYHAYL